MTPGRLVMRILSGALASRTVRAADAAGRARDWDRAARGYARALRLRPDLAALHVQHGHALKEQGRLHAAVEAYRRSLALPSGGCETWLHLGHVLKGLELWDEAEGSFAMALERDPGCAEAASEAAGLRSRPSPAPVGSSAERAMLRAHDLAPAVLRRLDPGFYRDALASLEEQGTEALLDQFGRFGLAACAPLNARDRFDPVFYRACLPGLRHVSDAVAYRHWLNIGAGQGRAADRRGWARTVLGTLPDRLPPALRPLAEAAVAAEISAAPAEPPLAGLSGWLAANVPEADRRDTVLAGVVRCLQAAGLEAEAEEWTARLETGDALAALDESPPRTPGLVIEAARRRERAGDAEAALAALVDACLAHPASADLRDARDTLADRAIRAAWDEGLAAVAADAAALPTARGRLAARVTAAAEACASPAAPLPRRPIRRIGLVGNRDLPQCTLYRIEGRVAQGEAIGIPVTVYDETADLERFHADLPGLDAVLFFRVPAHGPVIRAIGAARALGALTVYEIDDPLFDPELHPAPLTTYGAQLTRARHAGLALAVPLYAAALRLCDVGLASTEALAARMRPIVGSVLVHPNALGLRHVRAAALRPPPPAPGLRVVCGSATLAGKADLETLLLPGLLALARRLGGALSVTLVGPFDPVPELEAEGACVTWGPTLPLESWWSVLAAADVACAPLARTAANDTKSAIKWLEPAMLGVPCVLSRSAETVRVVEDGRTGLLCDTAEDFTAALLRLAADPALRRALGAAARAAALATHGPEIAASRWGELVAGLQPPADAAPPRPRVAIVNVFAPPQVFGGATRVVADNMADLRDRFDLVVFATELGGGSPGQQRTVAVDGVSVTTVRHDGGGDDMLAWDPAMGERFGAWLDAVRPALVHFHGVQRLTAAVVEAARVRGLPYVLTAHDGWWISPWQFCLNPDGALVLDNHADPARTFARHGPAAFERTLRLAPLLRGAAAVLAVSGSLAALYRDAGVPGVRAVPNGVSPLPVLPRPPRAEGPVRLGFVGGLAAHKGWGLVADALAAAPAGAFTLLAVDDALPAGEVRRARFGTTPVEFRGKVPAGAVSALYAAIDVLLAPSTWPEAYGLVVREALRCGCWVIASDRGATAEDIVPGRNGFVIDVADAAGLRAALGAVAAEPGRFRQPPAPTPLRTARQQADDLAALYGDILADALHLLLEGHPDAAAAAPP